MTEDQGTKTYERALKLEIEFGEYFTGESCRLLHVNTLRNVAF